MFGITGPISRTERFGNAVGKILQIEKLFVAGVEVTPGGGGSVTSVGLSLPASIFTVTGSPVIASGTLTGSLATQVANRVWAGPTTGADAAPTFRALVAADMPFTGTPDGTKFLRDDLTWQPISAGGNEFSDSLFRVTDNTDTTKKIAFELSGVTTATTRTATVPDRNFTLDQITFGTTRSSGGTTGNLFYRDASSIIQATSNWTLTYPAGTATQQFTGNIVHTCISNSVGLNVTQNSSSDGAVVFNNIGNPAAPYYSRAAVRGIASGTSNTIAAYHAENSSTAAGWLYSGLRTTNFTNTIANGILLAHESSAAVASGFGMRAFAVQLESSTTTYQDAASMDVVWSTATHASRSADIVFSTVNNASALTERYRIASSGAQTQTAETANTSGVTTVQTVRLNSTGTAGATFGSRTEYQLESSTTNNRPAAYVDVAWETATDGSTSASQVLSLAYNGTMTERLRLYAVGGARYMVNSVLSNSENVALTINMNHSIGTSNGYGAAIYYNLKTSTTNDTYAGQIVCLWETATHGSHASAFDFHTTLSGARFRINNNGIDMPFSGAVVKVNGTQVLAERETGWTAATGTALKTAWATYTAPDISASYTEAEVQAIADALQSATQRIKALEDALRTHGLIN